MPNSKSKLGEQNVNIQLTKIIVHFSDPFKSAVKLYVCNCLSHKIILIYLVLQPESQFWIFQAECVLMYKILFDQILTWAFSYSTTRFFYKNNFYKNNEAQIGRKLRTV